MSLINILRNNNTTTQLLLPFIYPLLSYVAVKLVQGPIGYILPESPHIYTTDVVSFKNKILAVIYVVSFKIYFPFSH